jgi:hypothetical protein
MGRTTKFDVPMREIFKARRKSVYSTGSIPMLIFYSTWSLSIYWVSSDFGLGVYGHSCTKQIIYILALVFSFPIFRLGNTREIERCLAGYSME